MTFYELYVQDQARFMQAYIAANLPAIALAIDDDDPMLVTALIRGPLWDEIKDIEANTDKEPPSQAADDVIEQSRRQEAASHNRKL